MPASARCFGMANPYAPASMLAAMPPRHRLIACVAAASGLVLLLYVFFAEPISLPALPTHVPDTETRPPHPIDHLVERATADFHHILDSRATTLHDAAARYRQRRGRHPPPGFDAWFDFASTRDAVIVEDFFDQIYHDLEPFWGIPAREVRAAAPHSEDTLVSVRNGTVEKRAPKDNWRTDHWFDMVNSVAQDAPVPDVTLALNIMDEQRVLVPWADIDRLVTSAAAERQLPPDPSTVVNHFTSPMDVDPEAPPVEWIGDNHQIWPLFRDACPPDSPARQTAAETDLSIPASEYFPAQHPLGSWQGYVSNWTMAKDPCFHPHLRGLHGTFIEPVSTKISNRLIPLFAGSKLRAGNEILVPAAMYWGDWTEYSGGADHGGRWSGKYNKFVWRGVASGGRNKVETWAHFHRHRFLSMINGTTVATAEANNGTSPTFRLPPPELYHVQAAEEGKMGEWLATLNDAGFNDLLCFPGEPDRLCSYANPHFHLVDGIPMKEQYDFKFLPDVDGNSYSARFRAFLLSTSLPIKTTIYREWHDSRIFPWVHFVPMDNTYIDFYGIMEYLAGAPSHNVLSHDDVAQKLAQQGQDWAQQVLRREDMQIYMYRLLLEFARVCDDNRARLGYTADL
ncbi:putative endoplasmic reticulum-resident kdel protein [Diplodia seriata]|uniref:Putative endoplasmic reticulum-resident kdel protein n=1 Tax=Diplodia seriata TaxID=420778 RepID=A0A0G2GFZ4_9PEZI|nr:putative endoplasmic reticulum-resident kdel protein [Diplodia seriata]